MLEPDPRIELTADAARLAVTQARTVPIEVLLLRQADAAIERMVDALLTPGQTRADRR